MAFAWSYSRWSLWKKCPRAYKHKNIDKLPDPGGPALAKGRQVHEDIEGWLNGKIAERPAALGKFVALADGMKALPPDQRLVEHQVAFDRDLRATSWFGKSTWFRAAYDVLFPSKKDASACDWKTGRRYPGYEDQQQLFALPLFWADPGLETFTGHWVYLDSGEVDTVTFNRAQVFGSSGDPAANDGLHGVWRGNAAMMEADQAFLPKPSKESCQWCAFSAHKGGVCRESAYVKV